MILEKQLHVYQWSSGSFQNTHAWGLEKHHPWLLSCILVPRGKLESHLLGWVGHVITEEHAVIESKQTFKPFPARLAEKKWKLALFLMCSRLMVKDWNHFSQQNLVKIPELILHGCESSCCVIAGMLQDGAWCASLWQPVLEYWLSFRSDMTVAHAVGKLCYLFILDEVSQIGI